MHLMNQADYKAIQNTDYRLSPKKRRVRLDLHNTEAARKHLDGTGTSLTMLVDFLLCIFCRQKETQAKASRRRTRRE